MTTPKHVKAWAGFDSEKNTILSQVTAEKRYHDSIQVEIMPVEVAEAMMAVIQAAYHVCLCIDKINQEAYLETLSNELKAYDNLTQPKEEKHD